MRTMCQECLEMILTLQRILSNINAFTLPSLYQEISDGIMKISPLPSSFGDDHLCAYFVKLFPEFFSLKVHFRVVLYVVILWRRGSRREGSERKSWKESWVAIGGIETVGRSQTCNETPVSKEEEDARLM